MTNQPHRTHIASRQPAATISSTFGRLISMENGAISAPASQESFISRQSNGSSIGPRLQTSSSNVSQLSDYTDLTSSRSTGLERPYDTNYATSQPNIARVRTPEGSNQTGEQNGQYAITSPMSLASPMTTNGTKRTASGHVKNAPSLPNTPLTATFAGGRPRTDSISSTSSRAGELASTLKTRLGYAMAKVQQGWEHKNITEVEHLAAHKARPNRHSMSHLDYSRRPTSSGLSNGTAHLSMQDHYARGNFDGTASPPSKRHSGTYASFMPSSQPTLRTGPQLQPAADIRPALSQQRHHHTAPSSQSLHYSSAMSPPRTPVNGHHRPPTIRTDTQTAEAEREALQALFQLGSPHASQVSRQNNASQASSSQASPLRAEFATPRKVTFARSESDSSAQLSGSEDSMPETREAAMQEA